MRIFVSYRRDDSVYQTGRLCDRLVAAFGAESIFKDVDSIPVGLDFRDVIRAEIERSQVLLAVIGETWLNASAAGGGRRLDDPADYVRIEIETALAHGIPVVPLLFGKANMPAPEELPAGLSGLAFRHGLRIQPDPNFHPDVDRLIASLGTTASGATAGAGGKPPDRAPADSPAPRAGALAPAALFSAVASLVPRRVSRIMVVALIVAIVMCIAVSVIAWRLLHRPDPMMELRRQEIARQVASMRAEPMSAARTPPTPVQLVDVAAQSENVAFEILSDERLVDMRGWKDVPTQRLNELVSVIVTTRRIHMKKTAPADQLILQARTSGAELFCHCPEFPYVVSAQKADAFVGTERMKVRNLIIDVSSVPVGREFELRAVFTYWNSLQTEQEQWFGLIGYKQSLKVSLLLVFPTNKPYTSYSLMVALTDKAVPINYDGPQIVLTSPSKDWVYWEVPTPEMGHVYRLHWKW